MAGEVEVGGLGAMGYIIYIFYRYKLTMAKVPQLDISALEAEFDEQMQDCRIREKRLSRANEVLCTALSPRSAQPTFLQIPQIPNHLQLD